MATTGNPFGDMLNSILAAASAATGASAGPTEADRSQPEARTFIRQSTPIPIAYGRVKLPVNVIEKVAADGDLDQAWTSLTGYYYGQTVAYTSSGTVRVFECVQSGTSDAVAPGGFSGEGTGIVDGTCKWDFKNRSMSDVLAWYQHFIAILCEGEIDGTVRNFYFNKQSTTGMGWGVELRDGPDDLSQTLIGGVGYNTTTAYQHSAILQTADRSCQTGTQKELPEMAVDFVAVNFPDFGTTHYNTIELVNPADIIIEIMTHARRGCGMASSVLGKGLGRDADGLAADSYRTYCDAAGFRFSMAIDSQTPALEIIKTLLTASNSDAVWSQGKLKVRPLGDEAIASPIYLDYLGGPNPYTPSNSSVRDFTTNDYLDLENPVQVTRRSLADCFNAFPVEYIDIGAEHALLTVEDLDQESVDLSGLGLRRAGITSLGVGLANGQPATMLSRIFAQRSMRVRNTYTFRVGWRHVDLEPTDVITITDTVTGLTALPARIVSTEETLEGITITAEDYPAGVWAATAYTPQANSGYHPQERLTGERLWTLGDGSRNLDFVRDGTTFRRIAGVDATNKATSSSLANGAVVEAAIDAQAVTAAKIGDSAVASVHVAPGDARQYANHNANFQQWTRG